MMPIYLSIAYVIFVTFPLALAVSIFLRRRQVRQQIEKIKTAREISPRA